MVKKKQRTGYSTDLSDTEWTCIADLVAQRPEPGRPRTVDIRSVVNAIFYLNRTGCQWELLPTDFPDYRHVNYYYHKWLDDGTWDAISTL